jgi:hypothetical protein
VVVLVSWGPLKSRNLLWRLLKMTLAQLIYILVLTSATIIMSFFAT